MVQPILTVCSSTMGWEMLFCWLFVTFVEGFPKWQATFSLLCQTSYKSYRQKAVWRGFPLTRLTVYRLASHLSTATAMSAEASAPHGWTLSWKDLPILRRIWSWNTWKHCSWYAGPWLSLSYGRYCCSKGHLASTLLCTSFWNSSILCVSLTCGNLLSYCLRKSEHVALWDVCKIRLLSPEEVYMCWAKSAFKLVLAVPG